MPKPPILPTIDWPAVFDSAQDYDAWIDAAESPDNAAAMRKALASLSLEAPAAAALAALPRTVHVVAIAEDWCGDVLRHVPALQRLAEAAPKLEVRYITREAHKEVFVRFLTNGGEAIPKFVFLSDQFVECGNWGPMPADCRHIIARGKACGQGGAAREKVSARYDADPELREVIHELTALVMTAACAAP